MAYISILITAYNRADSIGKALDSIPDRDDLEIIVVDDCSTDDLVGALSKSNKTIKCIRLKKNQGVGHARNIALRYASGTWICWLDSDDFFTPDINELFDDLYKFEKDYNCINIQYLDNNEQAFKDPCAPWSSIYKKEIYDLVEFPEVRVAEDKYWKEKVKKFYKDRIKSKTVDKVYYRYNYPSVDSLDYKANQEKKNKVFKEDTDYIEKYKKNLPIDAVVTFLNSNSKSGKTEYNKWKGIEIDSGVQSSSNTQAFGDERTRNWDDAFKYGFRGISKNMPGIRYVHLVCYDEDHVPEWLNTNDPRLIVHYHRDFMPANLVPTFNSLNINNYISNISNLSEYFICFSDDYYTLNKVNRSRFFEDNKPKLEPTVIKNYSINEEWDHIVNHNITFYKNNIGKDDTIYKFPHLPYVRNKLVEQDLIRKYSDKITTSKFRALDNLYIPYLSYIKLHKTGISDKHIYDNSRYVNLNSDTNYAKLKDKEMVCFNDTERLDNYNITKKKFNEFLSNILKDKCHFEV